MVTSTANGAQHDLFIFTNWPVFIRTQLGKTFAKARTCAKAASKMTPNQDKKIISSIDCIIAFKRGELNLNEALDQFCFLTGLSRPVARTFFSGIARNNIVTVKYRNKD